MTSCVVVSDRTKVISGTGPTVVAGTPAAYCALLSLMVSFFCRISRSGIVLVVRCGERRYGVDTRHTRSEELNGLVPRMRVAGKCNEMEISKQPGESADVEIDLKYEPLSPAD